MKHLVIAVSPDSSLDLLASFADIVVLDKGKIDASTTPYDTVYIRSHFSQQSTLPQNFRSEIESLVKHARDSNSNVKFIDHMDTVDKIIAFEDKWLQYKTFGEFMPMTKLCDGSLDTLDFIRPVYKKRLSSRGSGVTWDIERTVDTRGDWIVQESLDIEEELRVYIILGQIYPIATVKQSMTEDNKAQGVRARELTQDETKFTLTVMKQASRLDFAGIDIARTKTGELKLMEVNRSPGFAKFYELTNINLADKLYKSLNEK